MSTLEQGPLATRATDLFGDQKVALGALARKLHRHLKLNSTSGGPQAGNPCHVPQLAKGLTA